MAFEYSAIGKRIREAREAAGLSQNELGQKTGFSTTAISLFESGERKVNLETLTKISAVLSVSFKDLIEGYEKRPTYVSFRASTDALKDPKFRKALENALKKINEES